MKNPCWPSSTLSCCLITSSTGSPRVGSHNSPRKGIKNSRSNTLRLRIGILKCALACFKQMQNELVYFDCINFVSRLFVTHILTLVDSFVLIDLFSLVYH